MMARRARWVTRGVGACLVLLLLCISLENGMVSAKLEVKTALDLLSAVRARAAEIRKVTEDTVLGGAAFRLHLRQYTRLMEAVERGEAVQEVEAQQISGYLSGAAGRLAKERQTFLNLKMEQERDLRRLERLVERSLLSEAMRQDAWRSIEEAKKALTANERVVLVEYIEVRNALV